MSAVPPEAQKMMAEFEQAAEEFVNCYLDPVSWSGVQSMESVLTDRMQAMFGPECYVQLIEVKDLTIHCEIALPFDYKGGLDIGLKAGWDDEA